MLVFFIFYRTVIVMLIVILLYCIEIYVHDDVSSVSLPPAVFVTMVGGIVLGSVTASAVSTVSSDVFLYISVAIKASFF